jgi:transposase
MRLAASGSKLSSCRLIATCKLNDVDPFAYLSDVLTRIVNGRPNRDIDQLLHWAY